MESLTEYQTYLINTFCHLIFDCDTSFRSEMLVKDNWGFFWLEIPDKSKYALLPLRWDSKFRDNLSKHTGAAKQYSSHILYCSRAGNQRFSAEVHSIPTIHGNTEGSERKQNIHYFVAATCSWRVETCIAPDIQAHYSGEINLFLLTMFVLALSIPMQIIIYWDCHINALRK